MLLQVVLVVVKENQQRQDWFQIMGKLLLRSFRLTSKALMLMEHARKSTHAARQMIHKVTKRLESEYNVRQITSPIQLHALTIAQYHTGIVPCTVQ